MRRRDGLFDRLANRLLRRTIGEILRRGEYYVTYHRRPKRAAAIGIRPEIADCGEPCAIVLQGPVDPIDDFTLETVRLYRARDPACRVVVSTWRDTPGPLLKALARAGAEVVTSDKPADPGPFNVNLQLVSARAGIVRAREGGAAFVVKSRTDQRLYAPNLIAMLLALARTFPPRGDTSQRARIFGLGQGNLLYVPYHLTDQTLFGHADDILAYYDAPLRESAYPPGFPRDQLRMFREVPIGALARHAAAETYLAASFLARMGRPPAWTLEDSWGAFRDCFGIVDQAATDFYWRKGQATTLTDSLVSYACATTRREMGFSDWLLLHAGLLDPADARAFEGVARARFEEPVAPRAPEPPAAHRAWETNPAA